MMIDALDDCYNPPDPPARNKVGRPYMKHYTHQEKPTKQQRELFAETMKKLREETNEHS